MKYLLGISTDKQLVNRTDLFWVAVTGIGVIILIESFLSGLNNMDISTIINVVVGIIFVTNGVYALLQNRDKRRTGIPRPVVYLLIIAFIYYFGSLLVGLI